MKKSTLDGKDIIAFKSQVLFRKWLLKNHRKSSGIWLKLFKKHTGLKTVAQQEALHEALCFGWIDGQARPVDEESWLQKFTPRRPRSLWSKRNTKLIAELIKNKKMHASGLEEVQLAKKDGRWDAAYDSPQDMKVPAEFIKALKKFKRAYAFYLTLNKSNLFAIAWRLQTAKTPQTRLRRQKVLIQMMKEGKKIH